MVKAKKGKFGTRQKIAKKTNGILRFFQFGKSNQVEHKKSNNNAHTNFISNNFSNDIFISRSGLAKIDNLDSCLKLVSSDFIIF